MSQELLNNSFRDQLKAAIQTISAVLMPLILIGNIDMFRLSISVIPTLIPVIFIIYDYYKFACGNKVPGDKNKPYHITIQDKKYVDSWQINQLYHDVEFYLDSQLKDCNVTTTQVTDNVRYNYIKNGYYNYRYNLELKNKGSVSVKWNGNSYSLMKDILVGDNDSKKTINAITVSGESFDKVSQFLEMCKTNYKTYLDNLEREVYHFFKYDKETKQWSGRKLNTVKNYENVALPEELRNNVTQWLHEFENGKDRYRKLGIPYKLGILLHGPPGCGKNSLTYAMAYETKRNIYQLPVNNVITGVELKHIADSIPEGSVVVMEEVDTSPFFLKREFLNDDTISDMYDMIKKKSTQKVKKNNASDSDSTSSESSDINPPTPPPAPRMISRRYGPNRCDEAIEKHVNTEIGHILELMDGYNYFENSIIVMYTNHIDKLDPAVIRPGRIDHRIYLTYADPYQVKNLFKLHYNYDMTDTIAKRIAHRNLTTSFLINVCIIPNKNVSTAIQLALTHTL